MRYHSGGIPGGSVVNPGLVHPRRPPSSGTIHLTNSPSNVEFRYNPCNRPHAHVPLDGLPSDLDAIPEGQAPERATVWRKEGYHDDYTKSPILPDDRDDITEYVELLAMLHSPRECINVVFRS